VQRPMRVEHKRVKVFSSLLLPRRPRKRGKEEIHHKRLSASRSTVDVRPALTRGDVDDSRRLPTGKPTAERPTALNASTRGRRRRAPRSLPCERPDDIQRLNCIHLRRIVSNLPFRDESFVRLARRFIATARPRLEVRPASQRRPGRGTATSERRARQFRRERERRAFHPPPRSRPGRDARNHPPNARHLTHRARVTTDTQPPVDASFAMTDARRTPRATEVNLYHASAPPRRAPPARVDRRPSSDVCLRLDVPRASHRKRRASHRRDHPTVRERPETPSGRSETFRSMSRARFRPPTRGARRGVDRATFRGRVPSTRRERCERAISARTRAARRRT